MWAKPLNQAQISPPMKTDEEKAREENTKRIAEIKVELIELDNKTIRPLRAGETEKLKELEEESEKLREEMQSLTDN